MLELSKLHTPCFCYDKNQILVRYGDLQGAFPDYTILYSVKSNPFQPVVDTLAQAGLGGDAASPGEVERCLQAGMAPQDIYYSAPGKREEDLEATVGSCVLIADSFGELDRLEQLACRRGEILTVGIRVNPDFTMDDSPMAPSKFGIDWEQLETTDFGRYPHLRVTGVHIHLKSQVLDAEQLGRYYRRCFALARRLDAMDGAEIRFVNFGSGIGHAYDAARDIPVDLDALGSICRDIARENEQTLKARLLLEAGRFLVCGAGTFYTRVTDVKTSRGTTYVVVEQGMNGFLRPAIADLLRTVAGEQPLAGREPLYTSDHAFPVTVYSDGPDRQTVTIVGSLCTALDVIARDITVPTPHVGDVVAVGNAGSYGHTLSPTGFAGFESAEEYMVVE